MRTMIRLHPEKFPDIWVPKLHEGLAPTSAEYMEIMEWCEENCREAYHLYPAWTKKRGAQFEDDEDARSFICWSRLRWG